MNTSWLDIFHNTFVRTVYWMRSTTTERTPTTTVSYCGHWKNKNQVNYFLILGWSVGKYPHSFGVETGTKIDVAASSFISSWWNFRSHSASNNNNKDTYRNDTLFKHASQMSARPLKSNVQHLLKKKILGKVRLTAWILCVRFSGGNYNSYRAPEATYSFSEWVLMTPTEKYNIS